MRFVTYNVLTYGQDTTTADEVARYERVHEVIRGVDADVLAVQELIADHSEPQAKAKLAGGQLAALAEAVGLDCWHRRDEPAVALGSKYFHVGLLWRPGITPVRWRAVSGPAFEHAIAVADLDVGGRVVRFGSYHATPFGRHQRADEAERVLAAMTRPGRPPAVVGGDWNAVSADRRRTEGGRWVYYDPDPYADWPEHDDLVYQAVPVYDDTATGPAPIRRWRADRAAGEVLYASGLFDTAVALGAPWIATTGHWRGHQDPAADDPFGARRIDTVRVTGHVVPALRTHAVVDTELTRSASDHLPVVVEIDPAAIDV